VNMITGLTPGIQKLVPGAFVNPNFEVTYGLGDIEIRTLDITGDNKTKFEGEPNPPLTLSYNGFVNGDDENTICSGNAEPSYIVPASPVSINQLGRVTTYTDVKLDSGINVNNSANVITVSPGATVTLTGSRSSTMIGDGAGCPGCVTQHYIGVKDIFSDGFDANGSFGAIDHTFRAPVNPGVYYVTQVASWQYNIFDDYSGIPDNDPANAIAVVIVQGTNKPYAVTSASSGSLIGNYPITLGGCTDFINYGLVYTPGTLSVQQDPCLEFHWDANRIFVDRVNDVIGNPVGGVNALGPGKFGAVGTFNGIYNQNNSFVFDGTGYIATGTEGSVGGVHDFSVSAWVQTTSNNPMVVVNQRGPDVLEFGDGFYGEYYLKIGGNQYDVAQNANAGKAYFFLYDPVNNLAEVGVFSTTLVNDGNWHHIKGERTGTTIKIYVDGVLEGTANTAGTVVLDINIPTYIGADFRDNAAFFEGLIDDIRISICTPGSNRPAPTTQSRSVTPSTAKVAIGSATETSIRETKLYPNPATNTIRLQLADDVRSVNDFRVSDIVGRTRTIPAKRINEGVFDLNISTLSKGVYFITTKTTSGIKTFRFIKM
jgi:Concanavalin A-like lectin/glucanases superfamily/Secretion system C-terminal sorting domain/MBG domain (YGX type)